MSKLRCLRAVSRHRGDGDVSSTGTQRLSGPCPVTMRTGTCRPQGHRGCPGCVCPVTVGMGRVVHMDTENVRAVVPPGRVPSLWGRGRAVRKDTEVVQGVSCHCGDGDVPSQGHRGCPGCVPSPWGQGRAVHKDTEVVQAVCVPSLWGWDVSSTWTLRMSELWCLQAVSRHCRDGDVPSTRTQRLSGLCPVTMGTGTCRPQGHRGCPGCVCPVIVGTGTCRPQGHRGCPGCVLPLWRWDVSSTRTLRTSELRCLRAVFRHCGNRDMPSTRTQRLSGPCRITVGTGMCRSHGH